MRELDAEYQSFIEEEKTGLLDIINKYLPGMPKNGKDYAIHARLAGTYGIGYASTDPNSHESRVLAQRVESIFEQLGMDKYSRKGED